MELIFKTEDFQIKLTKDQEVIYLRLIDGQDLPNLARDVMNQIASQANAKIQPLLEENKLLKAALSEMKATL